MPKSCQPPPPRPTQNAGAAERSGAEHCPARSDCRQLQPTRRQLETTSLIYVSAKCLRFVSHEIPGISQMKLFTNISNACFSPLLSINLWPNLFVCFVVKPRSPRPGLEIFGGPNPRLKPWAIIGRHSVAYLALGLKLSARLWASTSCSGVRFFSRLALAVSAAGSLLAAARMNHLSASITSTGRPVPLASSQP